jgi:hypothetical protein
MPRKAFKQSGGGSNSATSTCPPNKFSFLAGCTSWSTILAVFTLGALIIVALVIAMNRNGILIDGRGIMMIKNDLSKRSPMNNQIANNSSTSGNGSGIGSGNGSSYDNKLMRENDLFERYDPTDDGHNGTGTPTSERIRYQVNPIIRDVVSYEQNVNNASIGRYEAAKNMERIINPLLPPERSYVNTYGVPINIPSRGPFQAYQQVGILSKENIVDPDKLPGNNNESNILPLFGRPTYTGSNRWNYYTTSDKFQSVKLPINIEGRKCTDDLGCDELRDGDMVTIPSYNGRFKVEIYDFDKPRYIPFVY